MLPRLKIPLRCCSRTALLRWMTALLCVASLVANLVLFMANQPLPGGLLVLQLIATLGVAWHLSRGARSINLQPAELADRMLKVQESERQRLSRELHDDIGQLLTAAKLQLDWLQRRMPADLQPQCSTLRDTLEDTLSNVRDVSAILNPRQLASLGLEASLRAHLVRTLASSDVHWSLECHQRLGGIGEEVSMAVFRITQEAVTNMLRHAQARNLTIKLQRSPEGLALTIQDDGRGFTPTSNPAEAGQRGMAGMQERVVALKGNLTITSQLGLGTRIDVIFPWPPRTHERARTPASHDL
ncbi:sensor histidine kinase [Pseudomonas sp. SWI6]|uniref:histidine kinase n=1 Tax=Pseudomonas taiwanensis TaxID=470150 RepID=A0ABR6V8F1_9PSED|nr:MULTISPECIES: sensor histidine kinase [Pseudomonas]AVD84082.1 sensor histidine kinase [Pseudomonas sp. SWI6]MBC3476778.1 sensor histidine kinase [Pseudomonas taiwanensis]MBC3492622.1 sensor histidine kinase [Pseudomonas taiwanensis]MDT8921818.1 sensor histidine kinase [Pseudomonas taiwanensis]QQZ37833.1 sensor histidine kinase [Pseudomonas sp. SK2]